WDRADDLAGLRRRQNEIDEQLAAGSDPNTVTAHIPPPAPASGNPLGNDGAGSVVHREQADAIAGPPAVDPAQSAPAARMAERLEALQARTRTEPPGVGGVPPLCEAPVTGRLLPGRSPRWERIAIRRSS